jgi:Zn-dependent protease with chaperone function
LNAEAFLWDLDAQAMSHLRSIQPLNALAQRISESIGRPWFEAALNGVRLSEEQMPEVFALALRVARLLGLPYLPELYVSGESMWDTVTLGTDTSAFVSLGSVLLNMRAGDLRFVLAREMGHIRAGHTLWRTVLELLRGRRGAESILGGGLLQFLNPAQIVQGAIQAPLLAWKRHSEITADRAGLLVVGEMAVAERVLVQWALKSFALYRRVNRKAWLQQENESDDATIRFSEWTMTSNPYLARRLKLLREFARSPEFEGWRAVIKHSARGLPDFEPTSAASEADGAPSNRDLPRATDTFALKCVACGKSMRVPRSILRGAKPVNVRCPNPACRKVLAIRPGRRAGRATSAVPPGSSDSKRPPI